MITAEQLRDLIGTGKARPGKEDIKRAEEEMARHDDRGIEIPE
jgi:hypothetical protein